MLLCWFSLNQDIWCRFMLKSVWIICRWGQILEASPHKATMYSHLNSSSFLCLVSSIKARCLAFTILSNWWVFSSSPFPALPILPNFQLWLKMSLENWLESINMTSLCHPTTATFQTQGRSTPPPAIRSPRRCFRRPQLWTPWTARHGVLRHGAWRFTSYAHAGYTCDNQRFMSEYSYNKLCKVSSCCIVIYGHLCIRTLYANSWWYWMILIHKQYVSTFLCVSNVRKFY